MNWFEAANTIATAVGTIVLIVTLLLTAKSIRDQISESSYNVWRTLYSNLADDPNSLSFLGFKPDPSVDAHSLSNFLMILDMYANRYSGRYRQMHSDAPLLSKMMKTKESRKYWEMCRDYLFSDAQFIAAIDKIARDG
jgi:hypothetical protein